MSDSINVLADTRSIPKGVGVTIKGHTKKDAKLIMPKGVKEEVFLGTDSGFNVIVPDTNEELRKGAAVQIIGLPPSVVNSLKKVAGVGSQKQVDIVIVNYQETTNPAELAPAKKADIKMFVRDASTSRGVSGVVADKSKIDSFNADGKAVFSLNLDPKTGQVTT